MFNVFRSIIKGVDMGNVFSQSSDVDVDVSTKGNKRSSTIIIQYVRNKAGQKRGIVLAKREGNRIYFGYSLANFMSNDKFDRDYGMKIASGRLNSNKYYIDVNSKNVSIVDNRIGLTPMEEIQNMSINGRKPESNVKGLSAVVPNYVAGTIVFIFNKLTKNDTKP